MGSSWGCPVALIGMKCCNVVLMNWIFVRYMYPLAFLHILAYPCRTASVCIVLMFMNFEDILILLS